jgi:hypothetical protein
MPKNSLIVTSVKCPKELLDWFDLTFPGLNRSWFFVQMLRRLQQRFNNQHYPELINDTVDSIYDDLQNGEGDA